MGLGCAPFAVAPQPQLLGHPVGGFAAFAQHLGVVEVRVAAGRGVALAKRTIAEADLDAGRLIAPFAGAGAAKLTTPKAELEQTMAWATDFSATRDSILRLNTFWMISVRSFSVRTK